MTPANAPSPSARERLLDAAGELFYRQGINAVGINAVIARADIAKATLYQHFASKDDLVLAFLARHHERWVAWFTARVEEAAEEPRDRLLAVFDVLAEWFHGDFRGCAFVNTAVETPDPDSPIRQAIRRYKQDSREYLRGLAEAAGFEHPDQVADRLHLLVEGVTVTMLVDGSDAAARSGKVAARAILDECRAARSE
ncbi:MAG TPA: TetR/AcrR family transcriptional regulator [Chloroflexota bacterium]|nr:TetR/AcrR family transcriptional regulator [Chloroflexota bacterium]